ncbi:MAG: hypothetical protein ISR65_06535 [Bacteriovoracaceae bacterium]|nr:hypothetical protein [Bacteriovoracaceae bacterium]
MKKNVNKRPFMANNWLNSPRPDATLGSHKDDLVADQQISFKNSQFLPSKFFVTGWKGESLVSKQTCSLESLHHKLCIDARAQFMSFSRLNKSLRIAIFSEFLSFANTIGANCHDLDSHTTFWQHVLDYKNSPYCQFLDEFIEIYSFRVVSIYLHKIRFIVQLCQDISVFSSDNNLLNPASFLSKIFKKGSSTDLTCESLQTNQYSWYRPSINYKEHIKKLPQIFLQLSTTEMMKICTFSRSKPSDKNKLETYESQYSHSLSHKSFGQFLNSLLHKFPKWCDGKNYKEHNLNQAIEVTNCKFIGNNLTSLTSSYWQAQEHIMDLSLKQVICPDFYDDTFINGSYVRITNELQHLTSLVQIATKQGLDSIWLICKVMREKYLHIKDNSSGQISMFNNEDSPSELIYSNIVLNLYTLPKNNPHHYLISQLTAQLGSLKDNGHLFIFANQQLFVPSQSEKLEQLFKKVTLKAYLNFEDLKGKGEMTSYLYVFTKKPSKTKSSYQNYFPQHQKESCSAFRWNGELTQFNKFSDIVSELNDFFVTKCPNSTPIFQKEVNQHISFEFHQNAIVDGKLVISVSNDTDRITHPSFFKNLTKSCLPLDYFFHIDTIHNDVDCKKQDFALTSNFLALKLDHELKHPIVLVVNQTDPRNVQIELIARDSYKAKREEYGLAFHQYFGLTARMENININVFRDFFQSSIGVQIIQLSLNGGTTKLKSKLKALLIPKFFLKRSELPAHLEQYIALLKMNVNNLFEHHPQDLKDEFDRTIGFILTHGAHYPWDIVGLLSYFKHTLIDGLSNFKQAPSNQLSRIANFNNPMIIEPLLKMQSTNIFPNHPDIYIEFLSEDPSKIHSNYTHSLTKSKDGNHYLEVYSEDHAVLQIYSTPATLSFIEFILSSIDNTPISQFLQMVKVPSPSDLEQVINNLIMLENCFKELLLHTTSIINQTITRQISLDT